MGKVSTFGMLLFIPVFWQGSLLETNIEISDDFLKSS